MLIIICGIGLSTAYRLATPVYAPYQHPTKAYIDFCESLGLPWKDYIILFVVLNHPLRNLLPSISMTDALQEQRTGYECTILSFIAATSTLVTLD